MSLKQLATLGIAALLIACGGAEPTGTRGGPGTKGDDSQPGSSPSVVLTAKRTPVLGTQSVSDGFGVLACTFVYDVTMTGPGSITLDRTNWTMLAATGGRTTGTGTFTPSPMTVSSGTYSFQTDWYWSDRDAGLPAFVPFTVSFSVTYTELASNTQRTTAPITVACNAASTSGSISISPTIATLSVGQTRQFTATVRDATGAIVPGAVVSWTATGTALKVDPTTGLVTALSPGSGVVTATSGGLSTSATVTVTSGVSSITITPTAATIGLTQTQRFTAAVTADPGVSTAVTWSSSNPAVATVDRTSGVATGVATGSATITATSVADPMKTASATLTVNASSFRIEKLSGDMQTCFVNALCLFSARVTGPNGVVGGEPVSWRGPAGNGASSTSGDGTSAVSMTFTTAGTFTVTATLDRTGASVSFTVTVTQQARYKLTTSTTGTGGGQITVTPNQIDYAAGTAVTLTATPDDLSEFAGWSGACSGMVPTCTVQMTSDRTVSASFKPHVFTGAWSTTYTTRLDDGVSTCTWSVRWTDGTVEVSYARTNGGPIVGTARIKGSRSSVPTSGANCNGSNSSIDRSATFTAGFPGVAWQVETFQGAGTETARFSGTLTGKVISGSMSLTYSGTGRSGNTSVSVTLR